MSNAWVETAKKLEKDLWDLRIKENWYLKEALLLLESNPNLEKIKNKLEPVAILIQIVIQGLHPDPLGIEILSRKNFARDKFFIITMDKEPLVAAYNLNGEKVFEGVIQPTDHDLILKLAVNHYFVILKEND